MEELLGPRVAKTAFSVRDAEPQGGAASSVL